MPNEFVRWYGLYKVQKDLYAENESVFSSMITSQEWDIIMTFTGYGGIERDPDTTYTNKPEKSGVAYKKENSSDPDIYDETHNIYDLAGNLYEWTLKPNNTNLRVVRGGYYYGYTASYMFSNYPNSTGNAIIGSRLVIYVR